MAFDLEKPNFKNDVLDRQGTPFAPPWQRWLALLWAWLKKQPVRYTETGPPATGLSWVVSHGLQSDDVIAQVRDAATGEVMGQTLTIGAGIVTVSSIVDMPINSLRIVVIG